MPKECKFISFLDFSYFVESIAVQLKEGSLTAVKVRFNLNWDTWSLIRVAATWLCLCKKVLKKLIKSWRIKTSGQVGCHTIMHVHPSFKTSQELGNCPMGQIEALLKERIYWKKGFFGRKAWLKEWPNWKKGFVENNERLYWNSAFTVRQYLCKLSALFVWSLLSVLPVSLHFLHYLYCPYCLHCVLMIMCGMGHS